MSSIVSIKDLSKTLKENTFEFAIIASPPNMHSEYILILNKYGIHTFSEINLTPLNYPKIIQSGIENSVINFISSTFKNL